MTHPVLEVSKCTIYIYTPKIEFLCSQNYLSQRYRTLHYTCSCYGAISDIIGTPADCGLLYKGS